MSGICAIWLRENRDLVPGLLASMTEGLSLAEGERFAKAQDAGVGIGVSARFRSQQLYQDERILLACDAELINEKELADEFKPAVVPGANTATAALLAAMYERRGIDSIERLRGGFSVVIWDRVRRQLAAAIDGFGIKRLVYYQGRGSLLVASRIDSLLRSGEVPQEVDTPAIANILNFSANLGPGTILRNVRRLSAGTVLTAGADAGIRLDQYWDMRYGVGADSNEDRLSRQLESVVEESVRAHAKVEDSAAVGAFLSGGTDSSTVVGMMTRMGRGPVKAFSIGFQEQLFNELEYAEIASRRFQAEHHTYLVGAADCLQALPHMVRFFDEPFGNSSAIPTYFCARLAAASGVRTLLAGDGGDELFAGNEWYATDQLFQVYHRVPRLFREGLIEPALTLFPSERGLLARARGYVRRAKMAPVDRILSFQFLYTHPMADVFEPDYLQALGSYSVGEIPSRHYQQAAARDHLDRLLYMDMKITIADSDLPKVTCMAELAGIQVKFPFLDRSVAEFSGRIPARLKVKGTTKRYLFKRAFRNLLPAEILAKKKHGFGIPVATWLKTDPHMREMAQDVLLSSRTWQRGYFRREFVEELFRKHQDEESPYYGDILWTLMVLELWHRQFLDAPVGVTA